MLYIPDYETAFIIPQKVASTSIKKALLPVYSKEWERNHQVETAKHIVAFIRNPFDRIISCYHNQCIGEDRYKLGKDCRFKDFINYVVNALDIDKHFAPYRIVSADFVCRFETLKSDWEYLRKICIGLGPLEHKNKTPLRGHWSDYYDALTLNKVYNYYREDFQKWGY